MDHPVLSTEGKECRFFRRLVDITQSVLREHGPVLYEDVWVDRTGFFPEHRTGRSRDITLTELAVLRLAEDVYIVEELPVW